MQWYVAYIRKARNTKNFGLNRGNWSYEDRRSRYWSGFADVARGPVSRLIECREFIDRPSGDRTLSEDCACSITCLLLLYLDGRLRFVRKIKGDSTYVAGDGNFYSGYAPSHKFRSPTVFFSLRACRCAVTDWSVLCWAHKSKCAEPDDITNEVHTDDWP